MARIDDIELVAQALRAAAADEPEEGRAALVAVMLNRRAAARRHCAASARPHPEFGDGSLLAACRSLVPGGGPAPDAAAGAAGEGEALRLVALACLALAGELGDATRGAVYFHRHDETPGWAAARRPVALIGSRLYYRAD